MRRRALGLLLALSLLTVAVSAEPVYDHLRIIAPAAPGGGWDQTARAMQQALQSSGIVKSTSVENIDGAAAATRPTTPRPGQLPLVTLQHSTGRGVQKGVRAGVGLRTHAIHGIGHFIGSMPVDVLTQRRAIDLTSRPFGPARKPLHTLIHIVWNGHSRFHTRSMVTNTTSPK